MMNRFPRFADALARVVGLSTAPIKRLAAIGSGRGEECAVLLHLFPEASLVAIELDKGLARDLREELATFGERVTVMQGDAAEQSSWPLNGLDLVVARHPDVDRRAQGWTEVFRLAGSYLSDHGRVVVTAYTLPEATFIHETLSATGLELLAGSPYSAVPVALDGADRYILVYSKKPVAPLSD